MQAMIPVLLFTLTIAGPAASGVTIVQSVVSGGGTITSNGSLIVIGQPIVGLSCSSGPSACANIGFVPAASPPACPADANGDGQVNGADLSVLLSQFGQNVPQGQGADFNGDGLVNGADLSVLLSNFGLNC